MRIAVVIPAHNEEDAIGLVLGAIPAGLAEEIVVVDNASDDATAARARACGATVLRESHRGYGAACLRGIDYLRSRHPGVVVFLDADFSDHPEEMPRVIEPIVSGRCDLVIGSRILGRREPGALPPHARAGNRLATTLIKALYGVRYTDLGPFRAVRFDRLLELRMRDRDFGWTVEMQVKAARRGLRILEVPVSYRRRVGRSKISGTISGTLAAGTKILWTVVRERF